MPPIRNYEDNYCIIINHVTKPVFLIQLSRPNALGKALGQEDTGSRLVLSMKLIRISKEECRDRLHEGSIDIQRRDIEEIAKGEYQ